MILGCAVPLLWPVFLVVAIGIQRQPPHGC